MNSLHIETRKASAYNVLRSEWTGSEYDTYVVVDANGEEIKAFEEWSEAKRFIESQSDSGWERRY